MKKTFLVETPRGVMQVTLRLCQVEPDRCHGAVTITVLSGPLLTDEQADAMSAEMVAELVSRGYDVIRWWRA